MKISKRWEALRRATLICWRRPCEEQISTFKAYIEQQAAANREFMEKLLGAKDFQEAFRIQAEYFQSRLKVCAEDAAQIGAIYAEPLGK